MKVKANLDYQDTLLNRIVEKDEVIEVDEERAKVLLTTTYKDIPIASLYEEEPTQEEVEEKPQEEVVEKPKRARKKKD